MARMKVRGAVCGVGGEADQLHQRRHRCRPAPSMRAPSSASIVFSATIGSRSGRASVPNAGSSAKRAKRAARRQRRTGPSRKRPSTNTRRAPSMRGRRGQQRRRIRAQGPAVVERGVGDRAQVGVFPRSRTPAPPGRPARRNALAAASRGAQVAGQAVAQPVVAREEAVGAGGGASCCPSRDADGVGRPRPAAWRSELGPRHPTRTLPLDSHCAARSCGLRDHLRVALRFQSRASSGPPERTIRPPASTCTRSGTI